MLKDTVLQRFLTDTDDTGRFIVTSVRTGRQYFIEPIGDPHLKWGSIDVTDKDKKLVNKKGAGKYRGSIDDKDSLITQENGFVNIRTLEPGTSPFAAIEQVDAQYPDRQ